MIKQFLKNKILLPLTILASAGISYLAPAPLKAEPFTPELKTHTNFDEQERQIKGKFFGELRKADLTSVSVSLMTLLTEKCSGASGSARATFRPEKDIRIYVDAAGSVAGNKDQTSVAGEAGGKVGVYFPSKDKVVYLEAGASVGADNLVADSYNLEKIVTSLQTRAGIATKDFFGDLTLKFTVGRYDGKAYGQNLKGDVFGVDVAAYADFNLDGPLDVNAALRFTYENMKNLWKTKEFQAAIGLNYRTEDFSAQFAPYLKFKSLDSGIVDKEWIFGAQMVGQYAISKNVDIISGYSWDKELGHQFMLYFRFKDSPEKKVKNYRNKTFK